MDDLQSGRMAPAWLCGMAAYIHKLQPKIVGTVLSLRRFRTETASHSKGAQVKIESGVPSVRAPRTIACKSIWILTSTTLLKMLCFTQTMTPSLM